MGKRLFKYSVLGLLLLVAGYYIHLKVIQGSEINLPYDLLHVYLFFALFSILICISFELLASLSSQYGGQLGFIYMAAMALKMVLFCIVFRQMLFYGTAFAKADSLSLLIPIFLFLFYEVIIIARILNRGT